VQFLIAVSVVTGWSAPVGHSMWRSTTHSMCTLSRANRRARTLVLGDTIPFCVCYL